MYSFARLKRLAIDFYLLPCFGKRCFVRIAPLPNNLICFQNSDTQADKFSICNFHQRIYAGLVKCFRLFGNLPSRGIGNKPKSNFCFVFFLFIGCLFRLAVYIKEEQELTI